MDFVMVQLFGLCHSLEQQDHRPPYRRNVDGLEGRIQYQHRLLHDRRFAMDGRRGEQMRTSAIGERQDGFILPTYTVVRWVRVHPSGSLRGASKPPSSRRGIGRATARATTFATAPFRKALEHASSLAPVVSTSSTSKTRRLSTRRTLRP